ncbi:uncharacterized protein LOC121775424 [Salvia splendens]|uniref:uncharacterized protein LOC121775424 n=1 Tax=Salvia splendens TaxID=180675 RepID=UPI001C27A4C2|nr:uncharacterized protein LOC121775424 [Salvia splendens]
MRDHHGERVVVTADNSTHPVAKEGDVTIDVVGNPSTKSVKLHDVYHVPDLIGPTRTPSCSSHCYVMVLVDDHSRFTWVKFLKEKSEALSKFMEFRDAVEKKFGKIKCLRSDNGGEYMSDALYILRRQWHSTTNDLSRHSSAERCSGKKTSSSHLSLSFMAA